MFQKQREVKMVRKLPGDAFGDFKKLAGSAALEVCGRWQEEESRIFRMGWFLGLGGVGWSWEFEKNSSSRPLRTAKEIKRKKGFRGG